MKRVWRKRGRYWT